ncbi:MAG: cystathionine beta-lyase [Burkholderiales bacterium]|nr:MAG: cystathionine beta-lyase [Betaproteobacteria bacterium]TAG24649.1 MAG: cystathionine beta-lyase [Burkholderiales bacterium]
MSKQPTPLSPTTHLIHPKRDVPTGFRSLAPGTERASTVLFENIDKWVNRSGADESIYTYGTSGTPTTRDLQNRIAEWEGGFATVLFPSGLAAVAYAFLPFVAPGDHVLVPGNVYDPVRGLANGLLKQMNVTVEQYDPLIGAGISALMKPNTKLVWVETPGSITMEVSDLPAIAKAAHAGGALVAIDNTYSAGWYLRAFELGADISVHALTKYPAGHSDLVMGSITAKDEATWRRVKDMALQTGQCCAPDDIYLVLRGLPTMPMRMRHAEKVALDIANWIKARPEVKLVLHPALPDCPGHDTWKRDFTGSTGVFSFVLHDQYKADAAARFIEALELFGIGASWGGIGSLALTYNLTKTRANWPHQGALIRLGIGLEEPSDLIADLTNGFAAL